MASHTRAEGGRAHLARAVPQARHLLLVPRQFSIELLDLHLDGAYPGVCLKGPRMRMSVPPGAWWLRVGGLTEEIASCSVGLGFLDEEDPKMRFMAS